MKIFIISLLLIIFYSSCQNKDNIVKTKNEKNKNYYEITKEVKNITTYGFGSGNNQTFAEEDANINAISTIIAQAYGINFEYNLNNKELKEINKNVILNKSIITKENFQISNNFYSLIKFQALIETEKPKNIKPVIYSLETNINFNEYYKFINNFKYDLITSIIKQDYNNQKIGIIQGKFYLNDLLLQKNNDNLFIRIKFEIYLNLKG